MMLTALHTRANGKTRGRTLSGVVFAAMALITSTGRRGGRSGVRVYKGGRSPDETKRDEMKRSENERTKRKE